MLIVRFNLTAENSVVSLCWHLSVESIDEFKDTTNSMRDTQDGGVSVISDVCIKF